MVNVGIVGIGFMGVTHFKALAEVRGGRAYAIASRDPRKRAGDWRSIKGNFGGGGGQQDMSRVAVYETMEEMLADPRVELVDICLPTDMHVEAGKQALAAGKHVLLEKAISSELPGADQLLAAARKADRLLMVAHVLRFFPEFALVKDLVKKGDLGAIRAARLRRLIARPAWSSGYDLGRLSGLTVDLHIHDVDFIQHIFGLPRAVTSTGCTGAEGAVEHIDTQYEYGPDGPMVTAEAGWMVQRGCPFEHGYDVYFEAGTLKFNSSWAPAPQLLTTDGKVRKPRLKQRDGFIGELQEAVDAVRRGEPSSMIDARLGRDSLAVSLKEMRSAATGRKVRV
jgi:predicted dehydrogenase